MIKIYILCICLKVACYFQWLNSSNKKSLMRFLVFWFISLNVNYNHYVVLTNTIICGVVAMDLSELLLFASYFLITNSNLYVANTNTIVCGSVAMDLSELLL